MFGLINVPLAKNPMNWIAVGLMATIWLFAFHSVMQLWGSAKTDAQS